MGKLTNVIRNIKLKNASASKKADIMRKEMYHVGNNVLLFTTHFGTEPYLINIHDNVIVASEVVFLNHDASCINISRLLNKGITPLDKVGSIELFDNCFIGANTILMPNTSVGKNSIVAAGSIVTKNIPANEVWGGVPAHFIMTIDDYTKKIINQSINYPWIDKMQKMTNDELVKSRQSYFFQKKDN